MIYIVGWLIGMERRQIFQMKDNDHLMDAF